jgi:hypothetical protein
MCAPAKRRYDVAVVGHEQVLSGQRRPVRVGRVYRRRLHRRGRGLRRGAGGCPGRTCAAPTPRWGSSCRRGLSARGRSAASRVRTLMRTGIATRPVRWMSRPACGTAGGVARPVARMTPRWRTASRGGGAFDLMIADGLTTRWTGRAAAPRSLLPALARRRRRWPQPRRDRSDRELRRRVLPTRGACVLRWRRCTAACTRPSRAPQS